jgi:general secretion pathway protein G
MATSKRKLAWFAALIVLAAAVSVVLVQSRVQYRTAIRRSEESVLKTNLFRMRDALDHYHRDKSRWPSTLQELVATGYLRTIPEDPVMRARTWHSVQAAQGVGVTDVKSVAAGKALDGSRYSDW